MTSFLKSTADGIDRINLALGRSVSWLALAMAAVAFLVVVLRYAFNLGWVWMQEMVVHMHGILFMASAGFTLLRNGHVRVDVFYRPASARRKAALDIVGAILLLLPFCLFTFYHSLPYVLDSWSVWEGSREAGGLPGVFLLKTFLFVFAVTLALQAVSQVFRGILALQAGDRE